MTQRKLVGRQYCFQNVDIMHFLCCILTFIIALGHFVGTFLTLDLWDPGTKIHRNSYLKIKDPKDQGVRNTPTRDTIRHNGTLPDMTGHRHDKTLSDLTGQ